MFSDIGGISPLNKFEVVLFASFLFKTIKFLVNVKLSFCFEMLKIYTMFTLTDWDFIFYEFIVFFPSIRNFLALSTWLLVCP